LILQGADLGTGLSAGRQLVAPDGDHRHDLSAMREAITPLTRLVYVCNPNNPTGTAVTRDALETFIRSVPVTCTVIVDEAYMDLVDQPGVATAAALVNAVPNMLVLRTFSKLHQRSIAWDCLEPMRRATSSSSIPADP
jgi:histidinol-phosphate/aromatic aminotransferase/cobyric acid decarboxylase-like protein